LVLSSTIVKAFAAPITNKQP